MSKASYELAHCVVCGHTESVLIADTDDIRREVETLWAYHQRRLRPETPPPRLMDRVAFSERPPLRLVRCRDCGLVYRNPMERASELTEIYAKQSPAPDVLRALHLTQRYAMRRQARAIRAATRRGASGLEVGSYTGAFLAAARDEGLAFEGLDINHAVNAFVRTLGFTVHDGDLTSLNTQRAFDVVAVWNVFDQLADPRGTLVAARRRLRADGLLAIRVPNGAFYARLRRQLMNGNVTRRAVARTLLAQNNLLSFPYRWGFTPRALRRLLAECGFTVTAVRGDTLVDTADRWTRRWARVEEMLIKRVTAPPARWRTKWAPWFEISARRDT